MIILVLVILSNSSFGDVAPPFPYTLSQPNGFTFEARMFGDEHLSWIETMDGRIILDVLDNENNIWWYYATVDSEGFYTPSEILVGANTPVELSNLLKGNGEFIKGSKRLKGKFRRMADMDRQNFSIPFKSTLAESGVCKPLVILVDFPGDLPNQMPSHKYTKEQFAELLFAENLDPNSVVPALPGTYKMSVRDYYDEISSGKFIVSGSTDSIVDWTTTENSYSYYVDESQGTGDGPNGRTRSADAVCIELAQKLDDKINYADFDGNQDGIVDCVILIMEGWGSGAYNEFWSFESELIDVRRIDPDASTQWGYLLLDGVTINHLIATTEQMYYGMYNEYNQGVIRSIGTFCHEIGHVLGLPDLYDTDYWYDSDEDETVISSGIGCWGIMGYGNYNSQTSPAYMCAWSRSWLNWIAVESYKTGLILTELSIPPVEVNHVAFKIPISPSDSTEYFLLENRRRIGSDSYLLGEGLLIWHIDENFTDMYPSRNRVNTLESCYGVNLMQADGAGHLYVDNRENSGWNYGDDGDPFPGSTDNITFTGQTNPNSNSYQYDRDADGIIEESRVSGVSITNIYEDPNGMISCTVTSQGDNAYQLYYDAGFTGWFMGYISGEGELRAGILVPVTKSSYLRSVRTYFRNEPKDYPDDTFVGQVENYIIRVWEGLDNATLEPIHEQFGTVDWTLSNPPRKYGAWVTIPLDAEIFCRSGSEYYIEIQYIGPGYIIPFDNCLGIYNRFASLKSFYRSSGFYVGFPRVGYDWNIRAIFEELTVPAVGK